METIENAFLNTNFMFFTAVCSDEEEEAWALHGALGALFLQYLFTHRHQTLVHDYHLQRGHAIDINIARAASRALGSSTSSTRNSVFRWYI